VRPSGMYVLELVGTTFHCAYEHKEVLGFFTPSPNGRLIYSVNGTYTPELKDVTNDRYGGTYEGFLPALHGHYYVRFAVDPTGTPLCHFAFFQIAHQTASG